MLHGDKNIFVLMINSVNHFFFIQQTLKQAPTLGQGQWLAVRNKRNE